MKLAEALEIVQAPRACEPGFSVALACGFTPLHLQTFLAAYLQALLPARRVGLSTGLYGDLAGTVESLAHSTPHAAAIAIEWSDLDPRLGYRNTGGWGPADLADIVPSARRMLARLEAAVRRCAENTRTAVCLPTLPLPPVFYTPAWQAGEWEITLTQAVSEFGSGVARLPNASLVSSRQLDLHSAPASRLDFRSESLSGFPYTLPHAEAVGMALAHLIAPPPPKKGLITDLDDTLWHGIVGDVGAEGVAWDLASHAQIHGLYQQLLRALAEQGALIGVASKNDAATAAQVFNRPEMLLPPGKIFPMEVHWQAKSSSVSRILKVWNIAADSVVFVDDSPMELAEVEEAHPGIQCLRFPKGDYSAAPAFLRKLRSLFGKARVTEEDTLRLESIRQGAEFQTLAGDSAAAPEEFLVGMKARVTFDFETAASDPRSLELVNKTNQFNLNGLRYTDADWRAQLDPPGAFIASIAYEDRFGPLGKIAVVCGRAQGQTVEIDAWVMSCRAFSRRIEHQCLRVLLDRFGASTLHFAFQPTKKNGPTQDFFEAVLGQRPTGPFDFSRQQFDEKCPTLYHAVEGAAEPQVSVQGG